MPTEGSHDEQVEPGQAASPNAEFTITDVIGLPSPPQAGRRATRVFTVEYKEDDQAEPLTKDFKISIKADGKYQAEEFYRLLNCISRALQDCGMLPGAEDSTAEGITTTFPFQEFAINVREPGYLGNIYTLAAVTLEPAAFADNPDYWIIFGHKVGPTVMDEIFNWVNAENGLDEYMKRKMAEVKQERKKLKAAKK